MRAIILAAGRGSRMNNRTADRPKCLVTVLGKTILEWQTAALKKAGVGEITVVCGYRKEQIQGDFTKLENPRWAETNMVSTLRCAGDVLNRESCIISYSDIICRSAHVRALQDMQADIAITYDTDWKSLWEARFENPAEDAESFRSEEGYLREIGKRTTALEGIQGQYMGLLKFTPEGWKTIDSYLQEVGGDKTDSLDMTALLAALLDRGVEIATCPVAGGWVEVDNPEDVELYERRIAMTDKWTHDWRD